MILRETEFVGGLVGEQLDNAKENITTLVVDGFLKGCSIILTYIVEFGFITCEIGIIVCMLVYFCSKDKSAITAIIKLAFIYLLLAIVRRAL